MLGKLVQTAVIVTIVAIVAVKVLSKINPPAGAPTTASVAARPVAPPKAAAPLVQTSLSRGETRIAANALGQYSTDVELNGVRLHMLVDTGASSVALSYEDASAAGVLPLPNDFKYSVNTANGVAHVARVMLHQVRLGAITVYDVEAFVGERGALATSLLGMTFLSKLSRMEVADGALLLRQ
jgi:aspartyl protease family protein